MQVTAVTGFVPVAGDGLTAGLEFGGGWRRKSEDRGRRRGVRNGERASVASAIGVPMGREHREPAAGSSVIMGNDGVPLLQVVDIRRTFPGVLALDGVSLDLRPGEVHALVGENGAGKSTLIKIICGLLPPQSGELFFEGRSVRWPNPVAARNQGIVTVHQEPELFPTLSVAENMALAYGLPTRGPGFVDWSQVNTRARETVQRMGESIDVRRPASQLSVAHRQMIQVATAVRQSAKVVVLDEPTSALSGEEARWLFDQIAWLKKAGAGIIYISHRQEEIFRLADRVTVLRDGVKVWTRARQAIHPEQVIEAMVGRSASTLQGRTSGEAGSPAQEKGPVRLQVSRFTDRAGRFRQLDFEAGSGEIVGVYGLVGAGRSEFAQAVFGSRPSSGVVRVDGVQRETGSPQEAVKAGIAYVPEDRLSQGLCLGLPIRSNAVLSSLQRWTRGLLANKTREQQATREVADRLEVRYRSMEQPVGQLSGGNQQKVVLGRWLLARPKVLILDEPTRGVDVGAKAEIHRHLRKLAEEGCAIVLISSELPEVLEHADRVVVFREGAIAGEFDPRHSSPARIAAAALPRQSLSEASSGPQPSTRSRFQGQSFNELALLACVLGLGLGLMVSTEGFSLVNLLTHASLWTILGLAAACVIVGRGIDISIGSLVALSAASTAMVLKLPYSNDLLIPVGILAGILMGAVGGLLNGLLALLGRLHPIVVTLGTMTIYRGLVIAMLGGKPMTGLPPQFGRLAIDPATGFRGAIVAAALVVVLVYLWMAHTRSGRHVYALGSAPRAAGLIGLSRRRLWPMTFGLGGMLAGLAGVLQLSMSQQMQARLGAGWELSAIAVAVIGGVGITGGRGTVFGVVLGAILLRLVNSALVRWGVSDQQADLVVGSLILAALLLDLAWRGWRR